MFFRVRYFEIISYLISIKYVAEVGVVVHHSDLFRITAVIPPSPLEATGLTAKSFLKELPPVEQRRLDQGYGPFPGTVC